jgi:hypothetical protein
MANVKSRLEILFNRPRILEWWVWDTSVFPTQKLVALLLLLSLALSTLPFSHASEDLVKNGGFETGDFTGWTTNNSKVVSRSAAGTQYDTAHSGKYSARIGTETIQGRIAQTVSVPPRSSAKFTAWYHVEKGSSLTISLKKSDGSVIQQWSATGVSSWSSVTYDLDVSHAGQSVTIEFVGLGTRETTTTTSYEYRCDPVAKTCYSYPVEYESYKSYWAYLDDVSLTYEVVVYETSATVSGLPEELSTKLLLDGVQSSTIAGEQSKVLQFKIGETHEISVEKYVYKDNQTRYYCASESQTVNTDASITFPYRPQYYLSIISQYGNARGSGWYDAGDIATFSVDNTVQGPSGVDYLLIPWNVTFSFDHWTRDASSTRSSDSIIMDGPKTVIATWKGEKQSDYTRMLAVIGLGVAAIVCLYITRRKKSLKPSL